MSIVISRRCFRADVLSHNVSQVINSLYVFLLLNLVQQEQVIYGRINLDYLELLLLSFSLLRAAGF